MSVLEADGMLQSNESWGRVAVSTLVSDVVSLMSFRGVVVVQPDVSVRGESMC